MRDRHRFLPAVLLTILLLISILVLPVSSSAEETQAERVARLNREIAERGGTWTAGMTWPGSLSEEEKKNLLGFLPSMAPKGMAPRLSSISSPTGSAELPTSFDWRTLAGTTPVTNQGGCGSCWAFAAVAQLESFARIYDSRILDLSEQAVIDCNPPGADCSGGWIQSAYYVFNDYGAVAETCVPYTASDGNACTQDLCEPLAMIGPTYYEVPLNVNDIKQAIFDHGPVTSGF